MVFYVYFNKIHLLDMIYIKDHKLKIFVENQYHSNLEINFSINEDCYNFKAKISIRDRDSSPSDFFHEEIIIHNESGKEYSFLTLENKDIIQSLYEYIIKEIDEENDFFDNHYTGYIESSAYQEYVSSDKGFDYDINEYPYLLCTIKDNNGELYELRKEDKKLKYVKKDNTGEILRDNEGLAVYLSDDEITKKGLNKYETTIVVFNKNKKSIGLASDEFGSDGIWIKSNYQTLGIGTQLLYYFRKQFPESRQMGQMTGAGMSLARKYFRTYIKK